MLDGQVATCLYCQFPCEMDLFAAEPTLCCSWCQVRLQPIKKRAA